MGNWKVTTSKSVPKWTPGKPTASPQVKQHFKQQRNFN
jgi:hypothetical protein